MSVKTAKFHVIIKSANFCVDIADTRATTRASGFSQRRSTHPTKRIAVETTAVQTTSLL